jgi:predicted site-specific integrase-resolvase
MSDLLSSADVAAVAGVTPAAIRAAIKAGRIKVAMTTAGGIRLIRRSEAERFARDREKRLAASGIA